MNWTNKDGTPCSWHGGEQWDGSLALLEHKALSPEKFAAFEAGGVLGVSQRYAWQVSAAIVLGREHLAKKQPDVATTLPLVFSVERRDYDKETKQYVLSGVRAFQLVREPFFTAQQIEERCLTIVHNYLDGIVPDCDSEYPCDYAQREKREATPYDGPDLSAVISDAHGYHDAQSQAAYHTERMTALKASLSERLGPGLWRLDTLLCDVRVDKRGRKFFSVKKEA